MTDQRAADAKAIEDAYERAEESLAYVGKLLRTTNAGQFLWSNDHKAAVTGLTRIVRMLRRDVPNYGQHNSDK